MAIAFGTNTADPDAPAPKPWLRIGGVIGGLAVAVSLMVFAFLAPSVNSGPHDLPLAVSGPAEVVGQVTGQLEQASPGAFVVTTYTDDAAVTDAVFDRDAVGGVSIGTDGVTITVASGAGSTYAALLKNIGSGLESAGQTVTYRDVAPLTADDPNGTGLAALGLPLAFGGMISAVLLSTLLKNRPVHRILGSVIASVVVGLVVTAILQFGFHTVDGNYLRTSAALAFGMAAISLFVLGCESRFGFAGLGIGGLIMMFISNPLSGMATGWQWLPSPWGTIGQLLPIGASGTLIRSAAFFDGNGGLRPVVVLACWAAVGILLVALSRIKARQRLAAHQSDSAEQDSAASTIGSSISMIER